MSLWIPVTLAAAFFQALRFMLQRQLALKTLSAEGATFARFCYSAPLIAVLITIYLSATGQEIPALSPSFWIYGAAGGIAQILGTVAVVLLFKARNFAVGITFKKTEVIQSVLVGFVLLGEGISAGGALAVALGFLGVFLLSGQTKGLRLRASDLWNPASALGLASGAAFAVSAVCYRAATLTLELDDPLARSGVTLAAVTAMQMCAMALWLFWRDRGQLGAVWAARRVAVWVGLLSMAGSYGWFTAFTLQNAAYVKALGQVELVFSLMASIFLFKETVSGREWLGMGLLVASIVTLVLLI